MNPKELKIGNTVFFDSEMKIGKHVTIATIEVDGVRVLNGIMYENKYPVCTGIIPFDKIEGIEITEEILFKVGFERVWKDKFTLADCDGLYFEFKSDFIGLDEENICGDYDECVHIKIPEKFHLFQNLIFDLTGKEIKI